MKYKGKIVGLLSAGAMILAGCGPDITRGSYKDYSVESRETKLTTNYLIIYNHGKDQGYILGKDFNRDGRVDKIELWEIKKGSPIEKLASVEEMSKIIAQLKGEQDETN